MAVDVAKAWQRDAVALVPGFRHGSGLDRGDPAVGDAQPHVLFPAITDPRAFEPERSHHHSSILCLDIMDNCGQTLQLEQSWTNARIATKARDDLGLIDDSVVAAKQGRIVSVGPDDSDPPTE